jgi:predicted choloylglycine hydrolase
MRFLTILSARINFLLIIILLSCFLGSCTNGNKIKSEILMIPEAFPNRNLIRITVSGSGYERGLQHGKKLKKEIGEIVAKWKINTSNALNKDADKVLEEFIAYANFIPAIKEWTPELFEEVKGIADGSNQNIDDILVLNLLDEFWVYIDNPNNHHCSDIGVPAQNGEPAYVAQNMDIESYTDGYQTLIRITESSSSPEQLILTHPGLIALNGINKNGVGIVMNTIMQLQASPKGLPVAFVVRKILSMSDKNKILSFIQSVPHASGQSYIIGVDDEVYNFEASAGKVVQNNPGNENGTLYHTNHPITNDELKEWHNKVDPNDPTIKLPWHFNSRIRLNSLENGIKNTEKIDSETIMKILRSKDDPENPVCRSWKPGGGFTFASTIMMLGSDPQLMITAGPPDESEYIIIGFKGD